MSDMIGRQLGDYRVLESIGSGGMGEVYLAEHVHLRKQYALKVLPAELADDRDFVARFHDEARVMADLDHPGIVKVQTMSSTDGVYFLVMDYVVGPEGKPLSLHEHLRNQPDNRLTEPQARKWAIQIAEALAYAHERGIVHRDIKPANVLIDSDGNVKLTDFGLAKAVGSDFILSQIHQTMQQTLSGGNMPKGPPMQDTLDVAATLSPEPPSPRRSSGASSILGTYDYMAPEQRGEGTGRIDGRTDIYSFGVLLYRLLTGKRPGNFAALPSETVKGLSRRWDGIISRCLAVAPDDRYGSAEALLVALRRVTRSRAGAIAAGVARVVIISAVVAGLGFAAAALIANRGGSDDTTSRTPGSGVSHGRAGVTARAADARESYEQALARQDVSRLSRYGEQAWAQVLAAADAAKAATDPAEVAAGYERATLLLPAAVRAADVEYARQQQEARNDQFDSLLASAQRLCDSRRYTEAASMVDRALAMKPGNAQALALKGQIAANRQPLAYTSWPFDAEEAARRQSETAVRLGVDTHMTLDLGGGVTMEFVLVPAGEFIMGSPASEYGRSNDEGPTRLVQISKPFYMATCEVTQEQYEAIMNSNPSRFRGDLLPVEETTWNDAMEFCRKFSALTDREVRLPTEAEWEYSCRAGTETAYFWGNDFRLGVCSAENDPGSNEDSNAATFRQMGLPVDQTVPVASFEPNAWGLYDMHGNVWEWVTDHYAPYDDAETIDPQGPAAGAEYANRGGSWWDSPRTIRSANRDGDAANDSYHVLGLRVAVTYELD